MLNDAEPMAELTITLKTLLEASRGLPGAAGLSFMGAPTEEARKKLQFAVAVNSSGVQTLDNNMAYSAVAMHHAKCRHLPL
jgi:hypothetical protein